ncbi:hypothetical protein LEP1GSC036_0256 [Leptospira weilii str. 2006001853]|uniref:Uncharacterized protein n=2 Tax=Leptospira weilii TaxID=28184 RepID=A0A828Z4W6_9LEPT|nr:hypothetical protein LEP1GSC036_0256 [Leptospira weilii str. 2006001853]EMM74053.1 hypothetical protein LEP1GSC038_0124 [Leptospira weilii str. 2006001855]EMN44334.1 hypothetical protein LEP1GSC086_0898 [Leptospira weilii str. LNT 1234]
METANWSLNKLFHCAFDFWAFYENFAKEIYLLSLALEKTELKR